MVKVNVEKLEGSKVALTVEAPASVVDSALEKAYKTVVKRVNVPGFRRGKAPRFILERHFGKDILYEDAMKEALPERYLEAVKESTINPVDEPTFDDVHFKQGEPLSFKATVYVMPEVALQDYGDLSVAYEAPTVTDEEVEAQVSYLRESMTELLPLEEGQALEAGDLATCHVKGIEGGSFRAEIDQELSYAEAGKENVLVPGLGEALVGVKKGETKEFSGTYPAQAAAESEAKEGADQPKDAEESKDVEEPKEPEQPKEARFQVEVKECRRKHYPSDEDFLKNLSKATMDEVREDLKTRLLAMKVNSAVRQHSDKVEDALLSKATVEIPKIMIERRQEELLERFVQRLQTAGADVNQYFRQSGRSPEDVMKEFVAQAEKEVKRDLTLDAVGAKEGIKVPDEAVGNVVEAIARETGKDPQAVRTTLDLRGALAGIEQNLTRAEALKKIAVLAAEKAGTPLPEEKPIEKPAAEPPAEAAEKPAEEPEKEPEKEPARPEVK